MEINEFAKKVCDVVRRELGEEYQVELREVRKNNGIVFHGLLVQARNQNVVPTIYLESFLEAYESGMPFAEVIRKLMTICRENVPGDRIDMEFFHSFDKVRDRICYRLIGRKGNEELLADVPYIEFLDLAVCFYYAYQGDALGDGIILIQDSHVQMWKTSTAELLKLAEYNTPRLFPAECTSLESILNQITGGDSPMENQGTQREETELPMYVLSNPKRLHGAVCMLYPQVLEGIAARRQGSLYILPSSVHEVILLTDMEAGKTEELRRMIREVNSTQVAPEEILSDSLYYYDFINKKVKIIF